MSLPGFITVPLQQTVPFSLFFDKIFNSFNTNPYFIGLMMLFLNLGGKFLSLEITKNQERIFQSTWVRRFVIFSVIFIATRNVFVAIVMTIILITLISFIFNECSPLYLFKSPGKSDCTTEQKKEDGGITENEINSIQQFMKTYHSNIQTVRH